MTVLQLAKLRAALTPEPVAWDWPRVEERRIFNGRLRKVERPIVGGR